ncbi:uroporphyrinogen decarboxylase family protein [Candidatus Hydrogenedentota bacterium]
MTSRERVRAAIAREPVDKLPLGFYAVDHDIIEKVIGRPTLIRNKVETVLAVWEGRRDELVESYKADSVEFYKKIDCADLILFKDAPYIPVRSYKADPPKKIDDNIWEDKQGRIWKANREANDIMIVKRPESARNEYALEDFKIPDTLEPPDESMFEAFDYLLEQLGEERYLCSYMPALPMPMLGAFEDAMMVYGLNPELIHAANEFNVAKQNFMDQYRFRKGSAGAFAEEDMAGTNGPFISPDMWREMCFPYLKERIGNIKKLTGQVGYHCCGNTMPLMEMFIDAGLDFYQSLQTTAGMEVGKLKKMFGDRLCIWGGVPVEILVGGKPDDVRKAVRKAMEQGAEGSGFILGPSHSIAYGTKYDNFMAMLDEFVKLRDRV